MPDQQSHTSPAEKNVAELQLDGVWRVVVLNDPVNLMSYVVLVFKKVFGFDDTKARKHIGPNVLDRYGVGALIANVLDDVDGQH
jgi:hypothetical protein